MLIVRILLILGKKWKFRIKMLVDRNIHHLVAHLLQFSAQFLFPRTTRD